MKLIDRYVLQNFLRVFAIFFFSFTGLVLVIDAFQNLDAFMTLAETQGNVFTVVAEYYGYRTLYFFDQASGILILISAMFTVAWLYRHNELTALLAAGISKARVVRPVIVAAAVVTMLAVLNRELVIPQIRDQLMYTAKQQANTGVRDLQPRFDNQTDIYLGGVGVSIADKKIVHPNFMLPPELADYGKQLRAESARFLEAEGDRPAGYLFSQVKEPLGLEKQPSLALAKTRVLFTPLDNRWLAKDECFVLSLVDFDQLAGGQGWKEFSSTAQLIDGLNNPSLEFGADVRVKIHGRMVQPMLDMTLLMLGLPLVLRRGDRHVIVAVGLCGMVGIGFFVVVMGMQTLGANYIISPALSVWAPLMVFVPLAVALSKPMRE